MHDNDELTRLPLLPLRQGVPADSITAAALARGIDPLAFRAGALWMRDVTSDLKRDVEGERYQGGRRPNAA